MENKANDIIKQLVVTECMVATLMSNDPNASEDTTLDSPIDWPCKEREGTGKDVKVVGGNIIEAEDYGEIINHIGE